MILTHKHPDHVGSLDDVLCKAERAAVYIGTTDAGEVSSPRPLTNVSDGDEVFGLQVLDTLGHTAGHVSVFDVVTRLLVAGDALSNTDGLAGSPAQFTEDAPTAVASVRKLAGLDPEVILVGHGPPVVDGAADALEEIAASL